MQSPLSSVQATPSEAAARGGAAAWILERADRVLAAAILFGFALKFFLITRINVNWDEFYFLEMVHQYVRGDLSDRFQTFHVHLFTWLPRLGWSEIDQVIAGRAIMAILAIASAFLIYAIARRFMARTGALFAVLAYLSVTPVIAHGASFRVDPMVTFLSLLSVAVILCKPGGTRGAAFAGAGMALAIMMTIKSAFYVVIIGGVLWCVAPDLRGRFRLGLAFAVALLLAFAALYLLHRATLAPQLTIDAGTFLRRSASKVLLEEGLFPRAFDLFWIVVLNPLFWLMLAEGALIAWKSARTPANRSGWQALLPLVLALPVLTPILYRNAFSYFYPVILSTAVVLVGLSFAKHRQAALKSDADVARRGTALFLVLQCLLLLFNSEPRLVDRTQGQRLTLATIHATFPQPVPYIGGFGALADYPRSGFYMSSWGVDQYRHVGQPIFSALVARDQPPFLFADAPSLYGAMVPGAGVIEERTLLPEDIQFLRDNYIAHWGMLFVAGKHLQSAGGGHIAFRIAVGGAYRLETTMPATIDGSKVEPGAVVALAVGDHNIDFGTSAGEATLRWADAAPVRDVAPTDPLTFFRWKSWVGMVAPDTPVRQEPAS